LLRLSCDCPTSISLVGGHSVGLLVAPAHGRLCSRGVNNPLALSDFSDTEIGGDRAPQKRSLCSCRAVVRSAAMTGRQLPVIAWSAERRSDGRSLELGARSIACGATCDASPRRF